MREIFRPEPERKPRTAERVFYTITIGDVGKRFIQTTEGAINVGDVIGYVQAIDIGKRLYRVPAPAGGPASYIWQCENDAQRDKRTGHCDFRPVRDRGEHCRLPPDHGGDHLMTPGTGKDGGK